MPEIPCNGVDEDGDGFDFCLGDADGDGVPAPLDCNDLDPNISPLAEEILSDCIDENCDGVDDCDRDGDGVLDAQDCAPDDPAITVQCRTVVPQRPAL